MRRYIAPGFALWASVLLGFSVKHLSTSDMQTLIFFGLAPAAYLASSFWWAVRAAEPAEQAWRHAVIVWLPALPFIGVWLWLLAHLPRGAYDASTEYNGVGFVVVSPYALVAAFISLRGMISVLRNARADRAAAEQASGGS